MQIYSNSCLPLKLLSARFEINALAIEMCYSFCNNIKTMWTLLYQNIRKNWPNLEANPGQNIDNVSPIFLWITFLMKGGNKAYLHNM